MRDAQEQLLPERVEQQQVVVQPAPAQQVLPRRLQGQVKPAPLEPQAQASLAVELLLAPELRRAVQV